MRWVQLDLQLGEDLASCTYETFCSLPGIGMDWSGELLHSVVRGANFILVSGKRTFRTIILGVVCIWNISTIYLRSSGHRTRSDIGHSGVS